MVYAGPDNGDVRVACVRGLQETIDAGQVFLKLLGREVLSQYLAIFCRYVVERFGLSRENSNDLVFRFNMYNDREFTLWFLSRSECGLVSASGAYEYKPKENKYCYLSHIDTFLIDIYRLAQGRRLSQFP